MLTIENKNLCEYCFTELPPRTKQCPNCGGRKNNKKYPFALPVKTILAGRYSVGMVLDKDEVGITYLCYDLTDSRTVSVKEYFPESCISRKKGETAVEAADVNYKAGIELFYENAKTAANAYGDVYEFIYENNTAYSVMYSHSGMPVSSCPAPRKTGAGKKIIAICAAAVLILGGGSTAVVLLSGNRTGPAAEESGIEELQEDIDTEVPETETESDKNENDPGQEDTDPTQEDEETEPAVDNGKDGIDLDEILQTDFSRVKLNHTKAELIEGETLTLTAVIEDAEDKSYNFEWSSENEKIAAVDENGIVTAVGKGTTKITVKLNKAEASCTITVLRPVKGIALDQKEVVLRSGESISLKTVITPSDAYDKSVSWTSSDTSIVTVENGKITAQKMGQATITAKTNNGKTATCAVIVPGIVKINVKESELTLQESSTYHFENITLSGVAVDKLTDAERTVILSSSDSSVAAVNSHSITVGKPGTAVITFSLPGGKSGGPSTTCSVTVEKNTIAAGVCGDSLEWTLNKEGILTISGSGEMEDWEKNQTAWEEYKNAVKKIIIEQGVTSIGDYAFERCENLEEIDIPDSVVDIGVSAFEECFRLQSVVVPEGVQSIGMWAFAHCSFLNNIVLPESVTELGAWAFYSCKNLTSIEIPQKVTSIEAELFWWCESLKEITIPNGVTDIGEKAFYYCQNLSSITIPESVTGIGKEAFAGCSNLTKVMIQNKESNVFVGEGAFQTETEVIYTK